MGAWSGRLGRSGLTGLLLIKQFRRRFVAGLVAWLAFLFAIALLVCPAGALDQVSLHLSGNTSFSLRATTELGDDPSQVMMRQVIALFDEYQSRENAKH